MLKLLLPVRDFKHGVYSVFVVLFGEDVAFGGVFRCSNELKNKHGKYPNNLKC